MDNSEKGPMVAREKLAAGARKLIYINSFFSIAILQMVMILAENKQLVMNMVIAFTIYYASIVNRT